MFHAKGEKRVAELISILRIWCGPYLSAKHGIMRVYSMLLVVLKKILLYFITWDFGTSQLQISNILHFHLKNQMQLTVNENGGSMHAQPMCAIKHRM